MHRRAFLGVASIAASSMAADQKIPIAFAGGSHSHASAKALLCRDSSDFDLLGVWEEDPALRKKYEAANIKLLSPARRFLTDPRA